MFSTIDVHLQIEQTNGLNSNWSGEFEFGMHLTTLCQLIGKAAVGTFVIRIIRIEFYKNKIVEF